jgi:hypothetical protein
LWGLFLLWRLMLCHALTFDNQLLSYLKSQNYCIAGAQASWSQRSYHRQQEVSWSWTWKEVQPDQGWFPPCQMDQTEHTPAPPQALISARAFLSTASRIFCVYILADFLCIFIVHVICVFLQFRRFFAQLKFISYSTNSILKAVLMTSWMCCSISHQKVFVSCRIFYIFIQKYMFDNENLFVFII